MKAIFLCKDDPTVFRVFDDQTVSEIAKYVPIEKIIYQKEDVLREPEKFRNVEFIFSTWGMPEFTEDEIRTLFPALTCVFYGAGSVQKFARPFLNCGVKVFSAWAANAVPVAEMTVAQIILSNKGYFLTTRLSHGGGRRAASAAFKKCNGNYGETVGIIGAGMIGKLVIRMLKAYRLKVLVFDPFLPRETADELGVELCDLPTLFERSFVVSNHLANNAQTKGMIHYDMFAAMQDYGTFLNTGRGAQVVEADMVRALTERPTLTAVLDVTDPEPPMSDSPMLTMDNIILTSHIAGSQQDEFHRMSEYMRDEYLAFVNGKKTKYSVTLKMLETMA